MAEKGKSLIRAGDVTLFDEDDMIMIMMMVVMMYVMLSFISSGAPAASGISSMAVTPYYPAGVGISAYAYEKEGEVTFRGVRATQVLSYIDLIHEYPFQPWTSAYVINDGPFPVEVGVNHPQDRFSMLPGEGVTIDSSRARNKIAIMFFICQPSQNANVRVTGGY